MRCAIFFVPPRAESLCAAAASWLRRDPYTGASVSAEVHGLDDQTQALLTAIPRRYGFHATIKPPFVLAEGHTVDQLSMRLGEFVARSLPFEIELQLGLHETSFAFRTKGTVPELDELAARVVAEFDHFRSPTTEDDLEKRNLSSLSERQLSHLMSWGDPFVFDQYRFHMTLTGPVPTAERTKVERFIQSHFGGGPHELDVSQLIVAIEPAPHAPFLVYSVHPFASVPARLRA
jgi:hypothetical protein